MKRVLVGCLSVVLACAMFLNTACTYVAEAAFENASVQVEEALSDILHDRQVMALVYLTDKYAVRANATSDSEVVTYVPCGQTVFIRSIEIDANEKVWVEVEFSQEDAFVCGYIEREYLICPDERFLQWEEEAGLKSSIDILAESEAATGVYADIEQFPETYQNALVQLKQEHPNWVFVKMDTNLDWELVVTEEMREGRSLIPASMDTFLQNGLYSKGWAYATKEALEYYLDPRNGLTNNRIFQFELLSYNASYHENCEAALQRFLDNTFMAGKIPDTILTYAYGFWAIGRETGISPFHLAARVYQEQGRGTSPLISGTYPGYEGYYNYFNIGASGTTNKEVIENGLNYAKNAEPPWDSHYLALHLGAKVLGKSYINKGQDTLYLQKFDVDSSSSGMFWHQYMQNICAPSSEASTIYRLYNNVGSVDNMFVFKIPVYHNMPQSCPLPVRKFSDVDRDAWYYDSVEFVYDKGIMTGVATDDSGLTVFWPEETLSREMFVTTLWKKEQAGEIAYVPQFTDVKEGEWYTSAVLWAQGKNIVNGIDTNLFGVGKEITREQMATMLYRYATEYKGYDTSGRADLNNYQDRKQVSAWAVEALQWAVSAGIMNGKPDATGTGYLLEPDGMATRAECAAVLQRFVQTYEMNEK